LYNTAVDYGTAVTDSGLFAWLKNTGFSARLSARHQRKRRSAVTGKSGVDTRGSVTPPCGCGEGLFRRCRLAYMVAHPVGGGLDQAGRRKSVSK